MTEARYPVATGLVDVAVIIPAFNSGAYLDQALASVAGQTVSPSTVVVVDDCSSDDTSERARRWQGRLPLELIRLERNRGPGRASGPARQAVLLPRDRVGHPGTSATPGEADRTRRVAGGRARNRRPPGTSRGAIDRGTTRPARRPHRRPLDGSIP